MLILALDTSTRAGSVAVLRDRTLLGSLGIPPDEPYSASVPRDVQILLGQHCLALNQIDLFAVTAGPGSFTGLRVGLTAAKAWAEIFGRPIAAASGLEAIAAQAPALPAMPLGTLLASVLDARRGQIFGGLYRPSATDRGALEDPVALEAVCEDVLMTAEEFLSLVLEQARGSSPVFVSPTPDLVRSALANLALKSAQVEEVSSLLAPVIGRLGYAKALRGEVVDALRLDANYLRRSDAESKWTDR